MLSILNRSGSESASNEYLQYMFSWRSKYQSVLAGKISPSKAVDCKAGFAMTKHYLTITTLQANSEDDKLMIFFLNFPGKMVDILHKSSPEETICIKCQK